MLTRLFVYLGARWTLPEYKGVLCRAVFLDDGHCICGRNGTMLVETSRGERLNVLRRRLRKVGAGKEGP